MIVLTGGKTGGHIMSLIGIAKKLKEEYLYIGGKQFLEKTLCEKHNINFLGLDIDESLISLIKAFFQLKSKKLDINLIIATGGFVSFPVLLYAILYKIPIYLIEENLVIGKTNKFFLRFCKKIFISYPLKNEHKKYVITGVPIYKYQLNYYTYNNYKMDILIIGGSLGSKILCDLAKKIKGYKVGLVAGKYYDEYKDCCDYVFKYVDDLLNLMIQADLIISRAGALTTAEVFSLGKPLIVIPSMKTKKNHQYLNALYFEKIGCAKLVLEKNIDNINKEINTLVNNDNLKINMIDNQKRYYKNGVDSILNEIEDR